MKKPIFVIISIILFFQLFSNFAYCEKNSEQFIIRKTTMLHCKRGISDCEKCQNIYSQKYCLLDIEPKGDYQRPVIEVLINDKKMWVEYDVIKIFNNLNEAQKYAKENNISNYIWLEDDIKLEKMLNDDLKLKKLSNSLPKNWDILLENGVIFIRRTGYIFTLFENRINAPINMETPEQTAKHIKKYGKMGFCQIAMKFEDKWTNAKIEKTIKNNNLIYEKIKQIPEKLGITNLYNASLSRKGDDVYTPNTKEEEKLVGEYYQEKDALLKEIIKLPDYNSDLYSFFIIQIDGINDDLHVIYPEEASDELYKVKVLL